MVDVKNADLVIFRVQDNSVFNPRKPLSINNVIVFGSESYNNDEIYLQHLNTSVLESLPNIDIPDTQKNALQYKGFSGLKLNFTCFVDLDINRGYPESVNKLTRWSLEPQISNNYPSGLFGFRYTFLPNFNSYPRRKTDINSDGGGYLLNNLSFDHDPKIITHLIVKFNLEWSGDSKYIGDF